MSTKSRLCPVSPSATPAQWFAITPNAIYTPHCRAFAHLVKAEAPHVLNVFLLADFNIVLRDKKVTAGHVESLLRIKYGIKAVHSTRMTKSTSVAQLLQNPTLRANRQEPWVNDQIT